VRWFLGRPFYPVYDSTEGLENFSILDQNMLIYEVSSVSSEGEYAEFLFSVCRIFFLHFI
jgi:hypothetical protein